MYSKILPLSPRCHLRRMYLRKGKRMFYAEKLCLASQRVSDKRGFSMYKTNFTRCKPCFPGTPTSVVTCNILKQKNNLMLMET